MSQLNGTKIAMVLATNFEDSEAIEPLQYLEERGASVEIIGLETGPVEGKKGATLEAVKSFGQVATGMYDALVIPGGGSPENLRIHEEAVDFTREFTESGKPVAAICHGAQLLISADVLRGKTITCVNKIRDDVVNAGANYVDRELVTDGNLITSRIPSDLPAFNQGIVEALTAAAVV